jgi:hypothetical protein
MSTQFEITIDDLVAFPRHFRCKANDTLCTQYLVLKNDKFCCSHAHN